MCDKLNYKKKKEQKKIKKQNTFLGNHKITWLIKNEPFMAMLS